MKKLLLIFLLFPYFNVLLSQELEWVLKPSITDCSGIKVSNIESDRLIIGNGSTNQGVKDFKNRIILEPIYKRLQVSFDGEYIYSISSGGSKVDTYFDRDGNKVNRRKNFDYLHPSTKHTQLKGNTGYFLAEIEIIENITNTKCKKKIQNENILLDFVNIQNDTILKDLSLKSKYLGNGLIWSSYRSDRKTLFFDLEGNKLFETGFYSTILSNKQNLILVEKSRTDYEVWSYDFNQIYKSQSAVTLIDSTNLIIIEEINEGVKSKALYDISSASFIRSNCSRISYNNGEYIFNHNKDWIFLQKQDSIEFYNWKTKDSRSIQGELGDVKNHSLGLTSFSKDSLNGVYNYVKGKFVINPQCKKVRIHRNCISCKDLNLDTYSIYDYSGKVIIQSGPGKPGYASYNNTILLKDSTQSYLYNLEGKLLFKAKGSIILDPKKENWVYIKSSKQNGEYINKAYFYMDDLLNGKKHPFDYISDRRLMEGNSIFVAKKDGKCGLFNQKGIAILEMKYDGIRFGYRDKKSKELVYAVKEKDYWGIIKLKF
jgi:hypothetical protein